MNIFTNRSLTYFVVSLLLFLLYAFVYLELPDYSVFAVFKTKTGQKHEKLHSFGSISTPGIFTFNNVCLERLPSPVNTHVHQISFAVTQKIVIYDRTQKRDGNQRIGISGPDGHPWNYYDIEFSNKSLPLKNRTLSDQVAYFVSSRCPGNLHHFFEEEYIPLYSVVRLSNMLYQGANNVILYPTPKTDHNTYCRNFSTYDEIMSTLHTNGVHDVYYNAANNTCFRKAVFGSRKILNDSRDVVDHLIRSYNLSEICPKDKAKYFTVISRNNRRIININDLIGWVLDSGFDRGIVRVISFETLSIREQMIAACTSKVMIGINGAALQWSMLMPEGSHVVEMSWPSRSWSFFYTQLLPSYRLNYHQVELKDIRFNFTSYEFRIRNGGKVGVEERETMKKSPPTELWKWSDAFLHYEELNETLSRLMLNETSEF